MPIKDMMVVKGVGRIRTLLHDDKKTEEDFGRQRKKLKIEKGGNESLSIKHKEEIKVIFY